MSKKKNVLQVPDQLFGLLEQADKKHGVPAGTMVSIMQQEIGGNNRFLEDPSAYHYGLNAEGKRVAGHTGKISTAFGPFGILESTAAKPGYGVAPLKSKNIEDQIDFAASYLAGRSKQAGSLEAGLAGYGEGAKYSRSVMNKIGKGRSTPAPTQMAASKPVPQQVAMAPVQAQPQPYTSIFDVPVQEESPVPQAVPEQWQAMQQATAGPVMPDEIDFAEQVLKHNFQDDILKGE
jgi:hypothetical protein